MEYIARYFLKKLSIESIKHCNLYAGNMIEFFSHIDDALQLIRICQTPFNMH